MDKKDFSKEIEMKKKAVLYFNGYDLEREYDFYSNSAMFSSEIDDIKDGYEYMRNLINEKNSFDFKSKQINDFLYSYIRLVSQIRAYNFNYSFDNSKGYHQSKANNNIIIEISLFQDVINNILTNIDNNSKYVNKTDELYINSKLANLKDNLDYSYNELLYNQGNYHRAWKNIAHPTLYYKGRNYTKQELGDYKNLWKISKNESCHTILDCIKELNNLNNFLEQELLKSTNYNPECSSYEINELYKNILKQIVKSPNYFCYLNEQEKEDLKNQKELKKTR